MSHIQWLIYTQFNQFWKYLLHHILWIEYTYSRHRLRCKLPYRGLPMPELNKRQMLHHRWEIFRELGNKAGDIEICVDSIGECEVVGLSEDLDAVGESALATDALLEGGTCCTSAIDFSVEERLHYQFGWKGMDVGFHNVWRVSSCKTPNYIACSISNMSTNTVRPLIDVINQCFI